jgi:hypothetical protein
MIMNYVIFDVGARYLNTSPADRNPREKYAILDVLIGLAMQLKRSKNFGPELEKILMMHVVPELSSQHAWLASKACQAVSAFYNISWSTPQNYMDALSAILQHMHSDLLPVQFFAALACKNLISPVFVRDMVRPEVPNLLKGMYPLHNMTLNTAVAFPARGYGGQSFLVGGCALGEMMTEVCRPRLSTQC